MRMFRLILRSSCFCLLPFYLQVFWTRGQELPISHASFIFLESCLCSLLQGALRNAIATFVLVSPVHRDTIWSFLEQYDLPVVVGPPHLRNTVQSIAPVSSSCIIWLFLAPNLPRCIEFLPPFLCLFSFRVLFFVILSYLVNYMPIHVVNVYSCVWLCHSYWFCYMFRYLSVAYTWILFYYHELKFHQT